MTRAIILAAGEGNRLRPHTEDRPKAFVPLAGKPLLEWQLEVLARVGISDITIATGYRADQLESYGTRRVHNPRFDSTNMVVSLIAAREQLLSGEDLLIAYGDIIYQPNIVKALLADEADVSITIDLGWQSLWAMRMEDPLEDAETLRLDDDGNVIELGNPPKSLDEIEGQYMGLIRVSASGAEKMVAAIDAIDPETRFGGRTPDAMYMTDLLQHLIDSGIAVHAVPVEGGWLEVDTVEDLERFEDLHTRGLLDTRFDPLRD